MRPARKGPENRPASARPASEHQASMRPARKGPENPGRMRRRRAGRRRFNEAGPQGAGKPVQWVGDMPYRVAGLQ